MSTDGTDDGGDSVGAVGSVGARFPRRRAKRRLGLGAFDEQIADLTPAGHERVEVDPAPEEPETAETAGTAGTAAERPAPDDDEASTPASGLHAPTDPEEPRDGTADVSDPAAAPPGPFGLEDAAATGSEELPEEQESPADPLVGRTGARFNSRARRSRRDRARQDEQDAVVAPQADPVARGPRHESSGYADRPETNGVSADRSATHRREEPPTVPFVPDASPADRPTAGSVAGSAVGSPVIAEAGRRTDVRPYIRTNGRTRPRTELALETLVSLPSPRPAMDDPEHLAIGELCHGPRSVAEVAALLALPLGVARVLIDDMAVEGLLRVHSTAGGPHTGPDLSVLERVLSGLHRL